MERKNGERDLVNISSEAFEGRRPFSINNFLSSHLTLEIFFWTVQFENLYLHLENVC